MLEGKIITKITDWNNVDFICVKSKSNQLHSVVYYMDGHPLFEKALSKSDLEYIEFARSMGCYGTSEKAIDEENLNDRFYIGVNIKQNDQEDKLIDYLTQNRELSRNQRAIIEQLSGIDAIVNCTDAYKPLYYCGFSKRLSSPNFDQVRLYFKTVGADESVCYDGECINYLEKCQQIRDDIAFNIVKDLILTHRARLRCVGVEFSDQRMVKIKYYLCGISQGDSIEGVLQELKNYSMYAKDAETLLPILNNIQGLACEFVQVSSGYYAGDQSINLYIENKEKLRKKYYALNEGIVLRDIGGISFLIDIHEKHYYDLKNMFSVNEMGQVIVKYLMANGVCTLEGIVSYLRSLIKNYNAELYPIIYSDCKTFIEYLQVNGVLQEVM